MQHSFDTEIAKKVGVHGAIIYDYIDNICRYNYYNRENLDCAYKPWIVLSKDGIMRQFDYLTDNQIKYAIKKLVKNNLLILDKKLESPHNGRVWVTVFVWNNRSKNDDEEKE